MKYLMWDIDGTLLLTCGAGLLAMQRVVTSYYFLKEFPPTRNMAGRTDCEIMKEIVTQIRGRYFPNEAAALLRAYHAELPKCLPLCRGKVLKNVEQTLAWFARPDNNYLNCLLTGNTASGAKAKLIYYNLLSYFSLEQSFFGDAAKSRNDLARTAWQNFCSADPFLSPLDLIFIGDTPNDVRCARSIGSRCLIILEGSGYQEEAFRAEGCEPWRFLPCLPDDPAKLQEFLEKDA